MKFPFVTLILWASLNFTHAEERAWTDKTGRVIQAEMLSANEKSVLLKLKNGKEVPVPLDKLSDVDNAYIAENKDKVGAGAKGDKPGEADVSEGVDMPDRWPTIVPGPKDFKLRLVPVRDKKAAANAVSYKTRHFLFTADTDLDDAAQEYVGRLYESAWSALRAMPLDFGRVRRNSGKPMLSFLAKDMESYSAKGGMAGSAGMFRGNGTHTDFTLIPYSSLGLTKEGALLEGEDKAKSRILVHEITHHLTHDSLGDRPWIVEGMADYVGMIPYDGDQFDFSEAFENIKKYAMNFVNDGAIQIPYSLEEFFDIPQSTFYQDSDRVRGVARNYTVGAMLVAYFVHLDGEEGIRSLKDYMRSASRIGRQPDIPGQSSRRKKSATKELLGKKKTMEALEKRIVDAWKEQGITLQFSSGSGS